MNNTIKERQKAATLSIKLTLDQIEMLTASAIKAGFGEDWKEFAKAEFSSQVLKARIGKPRINSTSAAKNGKITRPSVDTFYTSNHS